MKAKPTEIKKRHMRFTDAELSIIKNTFAENEELLRAMRKIFLQMDLTDTDKALLNVFHSPELMAVVRKAYMPTLDPEAPPHQVVDLFMTIDIKDKNFEDAYPFIVARENVVDYINQQLEVLKTLDTGAQKVSFNSFTDRTLSAEPKYVALVARNTIIAHSEMQLDQLRTLAGLKDETPEETVKRLQQNSSQ